MERAAGDERYWVALSLVEGIGPIRLRRLWEHFGALELAWHARADELEAAGLDARLAAALAGGARDLRPAEAVLARARRAGMTVLTLADAAYPQRLAATDDPPPVLYVKGALEPQDDWSIAVVGTRRMSTYGRDVTYRLSGALVRAGLTIVSGLARGVDTCAHRAALEAGGRTIAVLGSGLDIIYPGENAALARAIMEHGALLSEFPPGTKPDAPNFPKRNRIVAGLCLGTLVTEAPEGSGALLTAKLALDYNREVFAVPGPIYARGSEGTNALIRQSGAKLVSAAEHITEELQLEALPQQLEFRLETPEDPTERQVLALLTPEPQHIDLLTRQSGLPAQVVSSTLTLLELKGAARQVGGLQYVRGH